MSVNEEERAILVAREYEKALSFYSQAEANAQIEIWDVVANRLYYATFHAVAALLVHDGHKVGSHKGAVLQFGLHYVQKDIFTKEEAHFYSQLQSLREKADYNITWTSDKQDLLPLMPIARSLIDKIGKMI